MTTDPKQPNDEPDVITFTTAGQDNYVVPLNTKPMTDTRKEIEDKMTTQDEALAALEDLTEYAAHKQNGINFRDVMDLSETIRAALTKPVEGEQAHVQKYYECGCVTCVCEDEDRCHGCGAKACQGWLKNETCDLRPVKHEHAPQPPAPQNTTEVEDDH